MTCKDCIHSELCYMENDFENFPDRCGRFIPERPQSNIRWTDKLSVTSSGDIIDFEGRVLGHINLEDMICDAECISFAKLDGMPMISKKHKGGAI